MEISIAMRSLLPFLCAVFLLTGCNTMEPVLSISESNSLETMDVKGRQGLMINQKLEFGEYRTGTVKRSWTRGGNTRIDLPFGTVSNPDYPSLLSIDYVNRNQAFYFQLHDTHGNISDVYSTSSYNSQDLQIGNNPNSIINILEDIFGSANYSEDLFYLQLYVNDETKPWQLLLDNHAAATFAKKYQGVFALDEKTYFTLKPLTKVLGSKGPKEVWTEDSMGFEIFNSSDESVGAVFLPNNGKVYLHTNNTKERFILANLSAALLLQENIAEGE